MSHTVSRTDAIRLLAERELATLTSEARAEQLWVMSVEGWDEDPRWSALPEDAQAEFVEDAEFENPMETRYDPVLMIWLESQNQGATNEYLRKCLQAAGHDASLVQGPEPELAACPCCGRRTLSARGDYDICKVCWWEDDGQDNKQADKLMGGPNGEVSLTRARANLLAHGIFDATREDLRKLQEPPDKYRVGRRFETSPDGQGIVENIQN